MEALEQRNPFRNIVTDKNTRLYVTFLGHKPNSGLKIPYVSPQREFTILDFNSSEVCSVLTLTPGMGTTDSMDILEKEFGKNVTTRNWNTILKLLGV